MNAGGKVAVAFVYAGLVLFGGAFLLVQGVRMWGEGHAYYGAVSILSVALLLDSVRYKR